MRADVRLIQPGKATSVPKLDRDRKIGLVCIALMFEFFFAGYFSKNQTLAGICVFVGIGFFLTVLVLMGKSVDKHGWD